MNRQHYRLVIVFTLALVMSSCSFGGSGESTLPTQAATLEFQDTIVSSLGEVVPEKWANLAFPSGGYDLEIQVKPGGCVGCGVCQLYCPSLPKAITVDPR